MPQVYNGIGTWYWGKTNIRTSRGACQFCKRTGDLRSYDTTKFFVVVFVPLLSLGQKRVISECPSCKRHLVLPLKKFNDIRQKEVGTAVEEYRKAPADPAKAAIVISKAIGCEDEDQFLDVAEQIERSLARDPDIQTRLGAAYAFFGHSEQAEAAYARSYQLTPDPEVGDLLAVLYLRQGRPDDAAPFLEHIIDGQQRDRIGYVYLLAEGYQAAGRHEDALSLLERVAVAFPGIDKDAEFNKYRTISLKNRSSGKSIRSTNLRPLSARVIERRPLAVMIPRLIAPALAVIAFCVYLFAAYSRGQSREVWFVNGLDRPYDIDVNGHRVHLNPLAAVTTNLPEGDLNIKSLDPSLPLPMQTCRVATPFSSRPFLNRTFVVNPDRAAIVYDEETTYSSNSAHSSDDVDPHHMYVGDLLYTFSDIDYPFQEFPQSLTVSDKTGELHKKKVAQWTRGSDLDRLGVVDHEIGQNAMGAYAKNLALCKPGDPQLVLVASAMLPPDEALNFLRPQLAARPVQVEWHRAYQGLMERAHPDVDLVADYRAQLQKDPENAALMYLLGRVVPDRVEELKLFGKSTQGPSPCPYGYFALSYDAMARADYAHALELARSALRLEPDNPQFQEGESDALLALGDYDALLVKRRAEEAKDPADERAAIGEAQLLALQGHADQARDVISGYVSRNSNSDNSHEMKLFQSRGEAVIRYAVGDIPSFITAAQELPDDPMSRFEIAVAGGKPDDAAAALAETKSGSAEDELLVYIVANAAHQTDLAKERLQAAIDLYNKRDKESRLAAAWLSATTPPDPESVCAVNLLPSQKRVLLTAMGLRDPAHRDRYFKAAGTFNFDRSSPYLTLKSLLVGTTAAGG
jgi:tetratricopeptide (TPR) repeat protein